MHSCRKKKHNLGHASDLEEINGEMDDLVDDFKEQWLNGVDIHAGISNNEAGGSFM